MGKNVLKTIRSFQAARPDLEQCVDFLVKLQQDKGPIIEAMTVLRYENPTLFSWLRPRLAFRPMLQMSLDIHLEYEEALRRLSAENTSGERKASFV